MAFSLEFQKFFSITRTIFSHSRSEKFWYQNTNQLKGKKLCFHDEVNYLMETTISFQKLTSAVSSLPLLLEKKRLIDMHTSLATAILDQIKLRKLDLFFELEEKILSKQNLDKSLKEVSKKSYRISYFLTFPADI